MGSSARALGAARGAPPADKLLDHKRLLEPLSRCLDLGYGRPSSPVVQLHSLFYLKEQYKLLEDVRLRRSRYRGHERVAAGVGLSIFGHNTSRWVRLMMLMA